MSETGQCRTGVIPQQIPVGAFQRRLQTHTLFTVFGTDDGMIDESVTESSPFLSFGDQLGHIHGEYFLIQQVLLIKHMHELKQLFVSFGRGDKSQLAGVRIHIYISMCTSACAQTKRAFQYPFQSAIIGTGQRHFIRFSIFVIVQIFKSFQYINKRIQSRRYFLIHLPESLRIEKQLGTAGNRRGAMNISKGIDFSVRHSQSFLHIRPLLESCPDIRCILIDQIRQRQNQSLFGILGDIRCRKLHFEKGIRKFLSGSHHDVPPLRHKFLRNTDPVHIDIGLLFIIL